MLEEGARPEMNGTQSINVAELFAGVGGFRLGLEAASTAFDTVFSSQWEPPGSPSRQFASKCYVTRFGAAGHFNEDIEKVLDRVEEGRLDLGRLDLVAGGFPCQDYSVAKPLNQAEGIVGKKGVLWWQIHRLLRLCKDRGKLPTWVLLENVDRLLKSPAGQRGRDFAIMLAGLSDLGYDVEWRVINAADYGFPQRRRRVFIVGRKRGQDRVDGTSRLLRDGVLAKAFPVKGENLAGDVIGHHDELRGDLADISKSFGHGLVRFQFLSAGFVSGRRVWTFAPTPRYDGPRQTLGDVLLEEHHISPELFTDRGSLEKWRYVKGAKNEPRIQKQSGVRYFYTEGALPFPDPLDRPSRTILTSEGGSAPSRSKHIVGTSDGRYRRLSAIELERLNGFPDDWTATGMTENQRAFCMGNALVVGLVERIAREIARASGLPLSAPANAHHTAELEGRR
jgi:DNA (cytosine-5)-methyltransferase 1